MDADEEQTEKLLLQIVQYLAGWSHLTLMLCTNVNPAIVLLQLNSEIPRSKKSSSRTPEICQSKRRARVQVDA